VREVLRAADTFPYDPAMTSAEARAMWVEQPPGLTVVADDGGRVLGTAKMGTNRPGPGSHIATASFMVAAAARGRGVGTALFHHALDWARERGYAGMQFNAVVETTARRSRSTSGSASRSSGPSPARSGTRRRVASGCT
jgi:GNAT superfamily N-acetyltransferase